MLHFYDFEVFKEDWIVVIINPVEKNKTVIVNDISELQNYYDKHKNEIWVGYNSKNYDVWILKSILLGLNPKTTNDLIIEYGRKGYSLGYDFRKFPLNNYDVSIFTKSLKELEGLMGNSIKESTVPFNIDRKLNGGELAEVIEYCTHDVEQTIEIFLNTKEDFDSQLDLIKTFNQPIQSIEKTKAQLTAEILGCNKVERFGDYDLTFVDTLKLDKYKYVLDWYKKNRNFTNNFKTEVSGIPHVFGYGGLHGYEDKPIHKKGLFLHIDVTSYYPSLMIEYDFLTRNCRNKNLYKDIYDKRIELKKQGKKKEQAPYKIILNGTYGISLDEYSKAYDPEQGRNVCVNGQLLLLDLIEKLEGHCELIQSNTDGLIFQIDESKETFEKIDDICYEWEKRTRMKLEFDFGTEIWQKDVNNYIFKFENGKLERKGGYVKKLSPLEYDLPIVNEAIVKFLTEDIPVEKTINDCNKLKEFQKIVKISSKYKCGYHNGIKLREKVFRVFASKLTSDGFIGKQKEEGKTIEKFANTPENCFIENGNVNGVLVPEKLNKEWYIELAKKRISDFGIGQLELF